jgi:hypothetical protein
MVHHAPLSVPKPRMDVDRGQLVYPSLEDVAVVVDLRAAGRHSLLSCAVTVDLSL